MPSRWAGPASDVPEVSCLLHNALCHAAPLSLSFIFCKMGRKSPAWPFLFSAVMPRGGSRWEDALKGNNAAQNSVKS